MTKLSKPLVLALGLGLLAAGLISITGSPASAAGSAPVNITQVSVPSVPISGTVDVSNNPLNVALASGTSVGINNPASSPVLQRNVDAGNFTEVGQKASNQVTLSNRGLSGAGFFQVHPDGTTTGTGGCPVFCVPSGDVFVLTDVEWNCFGSAGTSGATVQVSLFPNPSSAEEMLVSGAGVNSDLNASGKETLNSGVVFGPGMEPVFSFTGCAPGFVLMTAHGYLAPNL